MIRTDIDQLMEAGSCEENYAPRRDQIANWRPSWQRFACGSSLAIAGTCRKRNPARGRGCEAVNEEGECRGDVGRATRAGVPASRERSAYLAGFSVNSPTSTPRSMPCPVPASARDTVPLVSNCAVPDFSAPACASPCA